MDYTDPRWQNVALPRLWDGWSWARKPKCRPTPTHFSKFKIQLFISQISTHSLPGAQGPLLGGEDAEIKGEAIDNDTSHYCAPSRPGSPHSLSLGPTQSTHFTDSHLRLREGKRFVQGHTASKVAGPGIKHRCKVHVILPSGASFPLNSSPIGSISCSRVGIKAATPLCPHRAPTREVPGSSFLPPLGQDTQVRYPLCVNTAPGKPCRLQEHPPDCTELPLKKKKR